MYIDRNNELLNSYYLDSIQLDNSVFKLISSGLAFICVCVCDLDYASNNSIFKVLLTELYILASISLYHILPSLSSQHGGSTLFAECFELRNERSGKSMAL